MSFLFKIDNDKVAPNPEILLISPFKEIWKRDKRAKATAKKEFAYVEFMSSMQKSNPFRDYPKDKKEGNIIKAIFKDENWKPDKLLVSAIKKLHELQIEASISYSFYLSARAAVDKMTDFFDTVDLTTLNEKTMMPLYKPKDILSALTLTEETLVTLKSLDKKVQEDFYDTAKNKGDKSISVFATKASFKNL